MTSQEYTQWLKGFLDAVDNYAITKKQFDSIREKLKEVDDTIHSIGTPIGNGAWHGWGGTITTSNYPSGSTFTYTTGNGGLSTYTMGGTITSTTSAYVNQSSEDDEKLLLD